MAKGMDVANLFKELEEIDDEGKSKPRETQFAAGQRENLIMDMLIKTQSVQQNIMKILNRNGSLSDSYSKNSGEDHDVDLDFESKHEKRKIGKLR